MANWANLDLSVYGLPEDIAAFRKAAGPVRRGVVNASRSRVFLPEMQYGESGDLQAGEPKRFARRFERIVYHLQGRNTYYTDHFTEISARHPSLAFVLAYSDPNGDAHGSWLLLAGAARVWEVTGRLHREILRKHYKRFKLINRRGRVDYESDDAFWAEADAYDEMADVAAVHWDDTVVRWLRAQRPPRR